MRKNGKKTLANTKKLTHRYPAVRRYAAATESKRLMLGHYIVADPKICHGKPTFRGTRIMVWQILEMVGEGMAWQSIFDQFGGSITQEAVAEAVQLASKSFLKQAREHAIESIAV